LNFSCLFPLTAALASSLTNVDLSVIYQVKDGHRQTTITNPASESSPRSVMPDRAQCDAASRTTDLNVPT